MKFIHLSDLHLGKRISGFHLVEDQQYILRQILRIIDTEQPDSVVIAGDVYDKSIPSTEAMNLWDDFLYGLSVRSLTVLVISGNHDSPERLANNRRLLVPGGIHIAPRYDGSTEPVTCRDRHGSVNFYLLPFVKPVHVRETLREESIQSYTDAVRTAVAHMHIDPEERNVLVTHQFVTGATRSDSEEKSVGGSDNVDASAFDGFDYVALGHLHGPQSVGGGKIRYCGTPLKYSFSEAGQQKSVTVVEMEQKGTVRIRTVPLYPLRDMRELRGTYAELSFKKIWEEYRDTYVHVTLTDEDDVPDAAAKLHLFYPYLMKLDYDNRRTRAGALEDPAEADEGRTPLDLLEEFYERQNGQTMSEEQRALAATWFEKIGEEEG